MRSTTPTPPTRAWPRSSSRSTATDPPGTCASPSSITTPASPTWRGACDHGGRHQAWDAVGVGRRRGLRVGRPIASAAVVALAVATGGCRSSTARPSTTTTAPADVDRAGVALTDALQRSMTTTWKVDEQFDRTTASGGHIQAVQRRAQRPPDHLTVAGGTVDARAGGRVLACATDGSGTLQCRDAGAARPYAEEVAAAVTALRSQVLGVNRLYDVREEAGGCFALHLRVPGYAAPPFGTDARLCFDGAT